MRRAMSLVELLVVLAIIGLIMAIALPAMSQARKTARRVQCASNLRQIGIALTAYGADYSVFPFGVGADTDTAVSTAASPYHRRYSLYTQILPYIEYANIFNQINFDFQPFYPDTTGGPQVVTGFGPNETVAQVRIQLFMCPSDNDRMPDIPWGKNNYRSCNGSSWSGRGGNGIFGQITSIRSTDVIDGLSHTAAFSERIRGDGDAQHIEMDSDIFVLPRYADEDSFMQACTAITEQSAAGFTHHSDSGRTWLEGNMGWTRYNHLLQPGDRACTNVLSWDGVAMSASSNHGAGVNVLFGDGSAKFIPYTVDIRVWRALGTISAGEDTNF